MTAIERLTTSLGIYFTPRLLVIFFLGIASGLPLTLVLSTLSYWLSTEGLDKSTIGLFAVLTTPYLFKFLWAPIVDRLPIPLLSKRFGRRRGWLFFSQAILIATIMGLGASDPAIDIAFTAWMAFFVAFASATQDIVIDAYRIEILKQDEQGAGAAMIIFGYRTGNLAAGFVALLIAASFGFLMAYWAMAVLVLCGTVAALIYGEPAQSDAVIVEPVGDLRRFERLIVWLRVAVIDPFRDFQLRQKWLLILFFVVIYKIGDALASTMTAPFIVDMGFSLEEAAWANKMVGFWALMIGTYIGGSLIHWIGLYRALMLGGILMMVSNLSFAVLALIGYSVPMLVFTIGFENFATGIGLSVFVAYLSGLCNIAYTATQYALLSSLMAVGRTWISGTSGYMAEAMGWAPFFVATTLAALPGLILLYYLWHAGMRPEDIKSSA